MKTSNSLKNGAYYKTTQKMYT